MAPARAERVDLLALQGNIKRDPEGYEDDFLLQWRHYQAALQIFSLKPSCDARDFEDLVSFIAQVAGCFPQQTTGFVGQLVGLLEAHHEVLDSALRQTLVKALILLRNRDQVEAAELLPVFFRLFRCKDKALRTLVFNHIIADIKTSNQRHRNERLNRSVQAFLYGVLAEEQEAAAKRSLAVLTELYRRQVWRDARTVNVIASATLHPSPRIMLSALKFFLGQDEREDKDSDDEEEAGDEVKAVQPSKEEVYRATHKGTTSSKKKKMKKLKRVMATVKKQSRREAGGANESFAAMQLLYDPQAFAEKLFSRLQSSTERFETRQALMAVISRAIGVHKLLLLNFYPFLQKYIQPHQRDVTTVLAALVQACHDLIPPDTLIPVLKQLVDQFVNDRSRPEVMTVGIKTVRELCLRCPLVMNTDLLQDLAGYRKFKNKAVSSAARGLVGLFREIAPGMLEKKDRGRGANLEAVPLQYGSAAIRDRIEGAELLQQAELDGDASDASGGSSGDEDAVSLGSEDEGEVAEEEDAVSEGDAAGSASDEEVDAASVSGSEFEAGSSEVADEEGDEANDTGSKEASGPDVGASGSSEDDEEGASKQRHHKRDRPGESGVSNPEDIDHHGAEIAGSAGGKRRRLTDQQRRNEQASVIADSTVRRAPAQQPDSIAALKRRLADVKAAKAAVTEKSAGADGAEGAAAADGGAGREGQTAAPLEWGRILNPEDFERIRELRHKQLVDAAMRKHGLKPSAARREKLRAAAEEEAEATLELLDERAVITQKRVAPSDLQGKHKYRQDKDTRMASVMEGREGREGFGAAAGRRKKKTGGLSNREKEKKKRMPAPARVAQLNRRSKGTGKGGSKSGATKKSKSFKGHVSGGAYARAGGRARKRK